MTCVKIQKELLKLTINGQKPNLKMRVKYMNRYLTKEDIQKKKNTRYSIIIFHFCLVSKSCPTLLQPHGL